MMDKYSIPLAIIRFRMWMHFKISKKDDRKARKIFIIGHPKTGTTSLHRFFESCGLSSSHTPADWQTGKFECFSDFGQVRPYKDYDRYYQNSIFILNTRPLLNYLSSISVQYSKFGFTTNSYRTELMRRQRHFEEVIEYFSGRDNLVILNIERPGMLKYLAGYLGLTWVESSKPEIHNKTKRSTSSDDLLAIKTALKHAEIENAASYDFLVPDLTNQTSKAAEQLLTMASRVYL